MSESLEPTIVPEYIKKWKAILPKSKLWKINKNTQDSLQILDDQWKKEKFEQKVFSKYPRLQYLKDQLYLDRYSNINNIKFFLQDLSNLPDTTLEKIKQLNIRICISDKTVTIWSSNKDLQWQPRWRPKWLSRNNVWWVYKRSQKTIYVWRNYINWSYYINDWTMLHELWHILDDELWCLHQTEEFKNFHKLFYNNLPSYLRQEWPWWEAWCEEFFAQSCYRFFRRWEKRFSKHYNKDFYNYMKKVLT